MNLNNHLYNLGIKQEGKSLKNIRLLKLIIKFKILWKTLQTQKEQVKDNKLKI
jgi:hypothetical protein